MAWKKTKIKNASGITITVWKNEKGQISYSNPKAVRAGKEVLKVGAKGLSGIKDVASFARTALTNRGKGYKGGELIGPLPNKRLLAIQKSEREGAEERGNPGVSGGDADYGTGKEEQAAIDEIVKRQSKFDKKRLDDARAAENQEIRDTVKLQDEVNPWGIDSISRRLGLEIGRRSDVVSDEEKGLLIQNPTPTPGKNKGTNSTIDKKNPAATGTSVKWTGKEGSRTLTKPTAIQKKLQKAGFKDEQLVKLMIKYRDKYKSKRGW